MRSLKILIMDDEIFANDQNPAIQAAQRLLEEGHLVQVTDRMSEVLGGLQKKFFDVYVLDIDMSLVQDIDNASGSNVGRALRKFSSLTNIVVFSARGEVPDWFTAANYHFQGYVFKGDDGVENLARHIRELAERPIPVPRFDLGELEPPSRVLVYRHPSLGERFAPERIRPWIQAVYPDAEIHVCTQLQEVVDFQQECGCILLLHTMFRDQESTWSDLERIFGRQPRPHVIVAVDSSGDTPQTHRGTILNLVNRHPFRLLDLADPRFESSLQQAIERSRFWYGRQEVFEYPEEFRDRIGMPLTAEDVALIREQDERFDELSMQDEGDDHEA